VLASPHRLKLAVFAANVAGGNNLTTAPEALDGSWAGSLAVAQRADRLGVEALLPIARWRGLAEPSRRAAHRTFETFTWAAAVAACTRDIGVFATAHVPLQHPVQVAKMIATIDHVSDGRFGLNVVAGWNELELRMFGEHAEQSAEDRYAVAAEWLAFLRRCWSEPEEFDSRGEWFSGEGVLSEPRPVQSPGPLVIGAGSSPSGRAFAAEHCDLHVALLPSVEDADQVVKEVTEAAGRFDRTLALWSPVHVVVGDTPAWARAAYERMVEQVGDWQAAQTALSMLVPGGVPDPVARHELGASAIAGFFALAVVGDADEVIEQLLALSAAGVDGVALSFLDYSDGLDRLEHDLLPRLVDAGLREG